MQAVLAVVHDVALGEEHVLPRRVRHAQHAVVGGEVGVSAERRGGREQIRVMQRHHEGHGAAQRVSGEGDAPGIDVVRGADLLDHAQHVLLAERARPRRAVAERGREDRALIRERRQVPRREGQAHRVVGRLADDGRAARARECD